MWKDANRSRNCTIYDIYMKDKYFYQLQIRADKSLSELYYYQLFTRCVVQ